jgi:hypothetical protein
MYQVHHMKWRACLVIITYFWSLSREESVAVLVHELKGKRSTACKGKAAMLHDFCPECGYRAFSVSPSHLAPVAEVWRGV